MITCLWLKGKYSLMEVFLQTECFFDLADYRLIDRLFVCMFANMHVGKGGTNSLFQI